VGRFHRVIVLVSENARDCSLDNDRIAADMLAGVAVDVLSPYLTEPAFILARISFGEDRSSGAIDSDRIAGDGGLEVPLVVVGPVVAFRIRGACRFDKKQIFLAKSDELIDRARKMAMFGENSISVMGSTSAASPPAGALVFISTAMLAALSAAAITARPTMKSVRLAAVVQSCIDRSVETSITG